MLLHRYSQGVYFALYCTYPSICLRWRLLKKEPALHIEIPDPNNTEEFAKRCLEFLADTPLGGLVPPVLADVSSFVVSAIESDEMGAWQVVDDGKVVGVCGVLSFPLYFCPSVLMAQELCWWVSPDYRGTGAAKMMRDKLMEWKKQKGADISLMIAIENDCADRVGRLYQRDGYIPLEKSFARAL